MKGEACGPVLPPESCQGALKSRHGKSNGSGGSTSHPTQGCVLGKAETGSHPTVRLCIPAVLGQRPGSPALIPRAVGLWFGALEETRSQAEAGPPRHPPVYSGKQMVKGDFLIFSPKRSFLLRKRMMEVSMKNLLLQMESKSMRDSCMRFCSPRWGKDSQTDRGTNRHGDREREEEN